MSYQWDLFFEHEGGETNMLLTYLDNSLFKAGANMILKKK